MRLSTALSLRALLPAAAIALAPALYGLAPHADAADTEADPGSDTRPESTAVAAPVCGSQDSTEFPIATRLHGGPDHYARGGAWRTWHLELRNTTDTGCRAIHPIAVFVDRAHALRPEHIRFEFLDPAADGGTWRPVSFETTDQDENLGVFDDQFEGFTVPAGKAVDVQLRTRFADNAPRGKVTTNAIAVQRREDDGDWVGQSNDYEFSIDNAGTQTPETEPTDTATGGTDASGKTDASVGPDATDGVGAGGTDDTGSSATARPKDTNGTGGTAAPSAPSTRSLTPPRAKPPSPSASPSPSRSSSGTGLKESSPVPVPPGADTEDQLKTTPEDSGAETETEPETDTGTGTGTDDTGGTDTGADEDTGVDVDPGTEEPGTEEPGTEDPGVEDPGTTDPGTGTGTEDPGMEDPGTEDPGAEDPGTEDPGTIDPGSDAGGEEKGEQEDGGHQSGHRPRELAETGHNALLAGLGVLSVALLTGGTVLLVKSRRPGR